jgi:hypothetical protein
MSGRSSSRTRALALDEVAFGLSGDEREELLAEVDPEELERLELAVAELCLAALGPLEEPPARLLRRLSTDARARFGDA